MKVMLQNMYTGLVHPNHREEKTTVSDLREIPRNPRLAWARGRFATRSLHLRTTRGAV